MDKNIEHTLLASVDAHYFNQDINGSQYETMTTDFMNRLTKDESIAVAYYADSGYRRINRGLKNEVEIEEAFVSAIDSSIDKAEPIEKTIYRGLQSDFNYNEGDVVEFKSYVSTSYNPHKAVEFANKEDLKILMFSTSKGAPISIVHKEMEIVLPRGSKFKLREIIETDFRCLYPDTDYSVSYSNAKIYHLVEV